MHLRFLTHINKIIRSTEHSYLAMIDCFACSKLTCYTVYNIKLKFNALLLISDTFNDDQLLIVNTNNNTKEFMDK